MSTSPFREQSLYYQYEQVFWEGMYQPVLSTWVYLGKQILSDETSSQNAVGYVFAFWHTEMQSFGWHATSITRTFWSLEMANETMRSWDDFKPFVLSLAGGCCPPCRPTRLRKTPDMFSLAIGADK